MRLLASIKTPSAALLSFAIEHRSVDAARILIDTKTPVDDPEHLPLHFAVDRRSHVMVKILFEAKANPNIRNASGKTALHLAIESDDSVCTSTILDFKPELSAVDCNDDTPLLTIEALSPRCS